jgi:hypothetical protein
MKELSINILVEAKTEYTKQLCDTLRPHMYEGINSIYDDAIELLKENDKGDINLLMMFQNLLKRIPKWNQDTIEKEVQRIMDRTNCTWLPDLITAVFVSNTKILTAVRMVNNKKKINLQIPKVSHFIHRCYIECAREFYTNPFLIERTNVSSLDRQNNLRKSMKIIDNCIQNAVRKLLPIQEILKQYLGEALQEEDEDGFMGGHLSGPPKKNSLTQYTSDSDDDGEDSDHSVVEEDKKAILDLLSQAKDDMPDVEYGAHEPKDDESDESFLEKSLTKNNENDETKEETKEEETKEETKDDESDELKNSESDDINNELEKEEDTKEEENNEEATEDETSNIKEVVLDDSLQKNVIAEGKNKLYEPIMNSGSKKSVDKNIGLSVEKVVHEESTAKPVVEEPPVEKEVSTIDIMRDFVMNKVAKDREERKESFAREEPPQKEEEFKRDESSLVEETNFSDSDAASEEEKEVEVEEFRPLGDIKNVEVSKDSMMSGMGDEEKEKKKKRILIRRRIRKPHFDRHYDRHHEKHHHDEKHHTEEKEEKKRLLFADADVGEDSD